LVQAKPIVSIAWLQAVVDRKSMSDPLPDTKDYLPTCDAEMAQQKHMFEVNELRKNLFKGKIFVFLTIEQYKKAVEVVKAASGEVVQSFGEESESFYEKHKLSCIIAPDPLSKFSEVTKQKVDKMGELGFVLTKEEDIGKAILHSDSNQCCIAANVSEKKTNKPVKQNEVVENKVTIADKAKKPAPNALSIQKNEVKDSKTSQAETSAVKKTTQPILVDKELKPIANLKTFRVKDDKESIDLKRKLEDQQDEEGEDTVYNPMSTQDSKLLAKPLETSTKQNNFKRFKKSPTQTKTQKKIVYHLSAENEGNPNMKGWLEQAKEEEKMEKMEEEKAEALFNNSTTTTKQKKHK